MENIKFGHRPYYTTITLLLHYFYTTFGKTKKHGERLVDNQSRVRSSTIGAGVVATTAGDSPRSRSQV